MIRFNIQRVALAAFVAAATCSGTAWAQQNTAADASNGAVSIPDRLTAYVAFAPIDDGSFNVIALSPKKDPSIHTAKPLSFCSKDSGYATVRNVERLPMHDELSSILGCWDASGAADPLSVQSTITVKFFSPIENRVRQFSVNGSQFKPMSFDWRTEKLYAPEIKRQ